MAMSKDYMIQDVCNAVAAGLQKAGTHTARAAATANGVSAASQAAQGAFNAGQAAIANGIGTDRTADQYGYNSAQAQMANNFTSNMWNQASEWNEMMWQKAADWNEMMWQKQADFNSAEALKNRQWQQKMAETSYQRAVTDMKAAGLNPILATGGVSASAGGSGSAASVGGASMGNPSMSGAQGTAASGGLLNGISASESSYTGQMEYMSGMLGLLSTAFEGIATASKVFGQTGSAGTTIADRLVDTIEKMWSQDKGGSETRNSYSGVEHGGSKGGYSKGDNILNKFGLKRNID